MTRDPEPGMTLSADAVMRLAPVVPVLTVERVADAAPLADALVGGGLRALEITLRTADALEAIREMTLARPDAVVGAGTVLTPKMLGAALEAGARFIVSPGLSAHVVREAQIAGVAVLAGVATGTEIMAGLDLGLTRFKFFPAGTSGGAPALAAFAGPFADVAFCPTGGVDLKAAPAYLGLRNVLCVGGSWVAPKALLEAQDFDAVRGLAREAAALPRG